jgi:type I restriction enzyme, R subunit
VLEVDRVTHAHRHTVTDLISLIRFTLGEDDQLIPYAAKVQQRYTELTA